MKFDKFLPNKRFSFVNSGVALKEQCRGNFTAFIISVVLSYDCVTVCVA